MRGSLRSSSEISPRRSAIHREYLQLAVLIAVAAAAFFLTRAVAANNRQTNRRDAAEWFERGRQNLESGDVSSAVDAFRRATVKDRNNRTYVLAFARALAANGQPALARSALLGLRENAPEDSEVNLELARLAASQGAVDEAIRYYHSALYAPWQPEELAARRAVRLELIRFLLSHGDASRALPELLALSNDTPENASAHIELGQLFSTAGDRRRALDQFASALALDPNNGEALADAGEMAFELGDYSRARRYLHSAPIDAGHVRALRQLVDLVIENDPLERRIGTIEQRRRTLAAFDHAAGRLNACLASSGSSGGASPSLSALRQEADDFAATLKSRATSEADMVEAAVDLVYRIEQAVVAACPPAAPLDRALVLIGARHRADER